MYIQRLIKREPQYKLAAAYLSGAEPAPGPLWRFGRRTDTVTHGTHDMWQRYCIMATPSPVYLFKHV